VVGTESVDAVDDPLDPPHADSATTAVMTSEREPKTVTRRFMIYISLSKAIRSDRGGWVLKSLCHIPNLPASFTPDNGCSIHI
jgi:hypothetical protein